MSIYSSIYIPRVDSEHTEESIAYYMSEHYNIGTVCHVDFTPINKKPGFDENVKEVVKSAFVHFSDPWFCSDKQYHFQRRTYTGNTTFWNTIAAGKSYKIQVSNNEYWICLKNKNPVQRTMMNIHQVVENGRHLENLITEQAEEIKNLKETVEELTNKIDGVHNVVYQLIGGLFCQQNQSEMIDSHLSVLYGRSGKAVNCSNWPTTRQGDENQERIEKLEETLKTILEFDSNCFAYEQVDTKSECSSDSSGSSERIKNSYDLCGNA